MSEIKTNEVTVVDGDFVDDFESPAESHPMAAYHFKQAAEQQELAANASESGD